MLIPTAFAPTVTPAGVTVDVIGDVQGFDRLRGEWPELLAASASNTPFLTWDWLRAWWTHLAGSSTLNLLVLRDRSQLIAVAPMMVARRGLSTGLEFLGVGAGADYLDIIIRRGRERDAISALVTTLHALQLPLYLDHLPPGSCSEQLGTELTTHGWKTLDSSPDVCPFIDLTGHTWDTYLATLGASHRANVRRRLRAIEAGFETQFSMVETEAERHSALDALITLNRQRWSDRGGTTAFESPELCAFHDDVTRAALRSGSLRLYTLSLNGDVAAVMYGFAQDRRLFFFQHGFTEAYAKISVGLAVMALTIRAAIGEGLIEFDMLYGHESYKRLWARDERRLGRLQLFPPRISGVLLRRGVETRRALRAVAYQLGLKKDDATH